ncbi:MAG: hypothetical protein IPM57_08160 [Oligoflexia bacterium]|nr:hypothetical protein [Oligoflexia bacterium]
MKLKNSLFIVILATCINSYGQQIQPIQQEVTQLPQQVQSQFLKDIKLTGGFKSYNNFARERELLEKEGLRFKSKNEFALGFKDSMGWGLSALAVETLETKGKSSLNKFGPADPSLTITHPIYKSDFFKLTGAFRQYFPVSDRSATNHVWQHAYYLNSTLKMANKIEWSNSLTPRYFSQDKYKSTDTSFYIENWSTITKQFENIKWLRVGAGMHHQVEVHPGTQTGIVMDVYPQADFMLTSNIYAGPRIYFPTYVVGSVSSSAKSAALSEVQAEFYLQATL